MSIKLIQPVLIVPSGEASEDDVNIVNKACNLLQQWWETRDVPNLLLYHLRPASPPCAYTKDYFFPTGWVSTGSDDTPWRKTELFLKEQYPPSAIMATRGITNPDDLIYLVFLKDFDNPMPGHSERQYVWWGWGSIGTVGVDSPMRWAVVDYDLITDMLTASLNDLNTQGNHALGALAHEEGHTLGWLHTDDPYPNIMLSYSAWPATNIPRVLPK